MVESFKHRSDHCISYIAFRPHCSNYPILGSCVKRRYLGGMSKMKFTRADVAFRGFEEVADLQQSHASGIGGSPRPTAELREQIRDGGRRLDFVETIAVCEAVECDPVQFTADFVAILTGTQGGGGGNCRSVPR